MRCKTCLRALDLCFVVEALVCILALLSSLESNAAMVGLAEDREALLAFMRSADANHVLLKNWSGSDPCMAHWEGVICKKNRVRHVILESRQLKGYVDANSIGSLARLRKVSLKNNMLSGHMPTFQSPFLRSIWLSNNNFTGSIPDIYSRTPQFNKLGLSHNKLTGGIPMSLASVATLNTVLLDNNRLTGRIPPFNQSGLAHFNVSKNNLSGPIPNTSKLHSFSSDSFLHNPNLHGFPLPTPCQEVESLKKKGMSHTSVILLIGVVDVVLLCFLALLAREYFYKRRQKRWTAQVPKRKADDATMSSIPDTGKTYDKVCKNEDMTDAEKSRLVVFDRPGQFLFNLEELLRASAEMLGKGTFGTAYKALIHGQNGTSGTVAVKRLRDIQGTCQREFETQMVLLGQLKHPNIVPLLAYYYAEDEKLVVVEYVPNGSLFSRLHETHNPSFMPLNWQSRLKIARGVACGMAYLHKSLKHQKLPHGNLKSSNILLDEGMVPKVADFGMAPLLTQSGMHCMMAFKAPEYSTNNTICEQADVHSFGIILLELLTGKIPLHSSKQAKEGLDLTKWVCSKTKEEVEEVYDVEVIREANVGEKEALLEIAMRCAGTDFKGRPSMEEALGMVEAIQATNSPKLAHINDHLDIGPPNEDSNVHGYLTPIHSLSSLSPSF